MAKFNITGEFITNHVRNLWSENNFGLAFKYLSDTIPEMTRGQQLDLIEGRMKLIGTNDLDFVEDNDGIKHNEYKSLENALNRKKDSDKLYEEKYMKDYNTGMSIIEFFSNFNEIITNPSIQGEHQIEIWNQLLDEVKSNLIHKIPYYMSSYLRVYNKVKSPHRGLTHKTIANANFPKKAWSDKNIFNTYCDKFFIHNQDEKEYIWNDYHNTVNRISKPLSNDELNVVDTVKQINIPNIDYSLNNQFGWLSRDGKYYNCYYTGHDKLAEDICAHFNWEFTNNASFILENKGWIKIHTPDDHRKGTILFSFIKNPNQTQINKLIKYCDKHNIAYPDYINLSIFG